MASTTVRLPTDAHAKLVSLASARKRPMSDILTDMIERESREQFFDEAEAAYARLQADPAAWADYQAEVRSMDGTLMDGLEEDPWVE